MEQWVIYDHPRDHPEHFVVRRWLIFPGFLEPAEHYLANDLRAARKRIPKGMVCLGRQPRDDPRIVEVWI